MKRLCEYTKCFHGKSNQLFVSLAVSSRIWLVAAKVEIFVGVYTSWWKPPMSGVILNVLSLLTRCAGYFFPTNRYCCRCCFCFIFFFLQPTFHALLVLPLNDVMFYEWAETGIKKTTNSWPSIPNKIEFVTRSNSNVWIKPKHVYSDGI